MSRTYEYWYGGDSAPDGDWLETSVYKNSNNAVLDVKKIFISFAQKYFENHLRFTWTEDLRTTKLLVADKNAIELEVLEAKPGIILSRGPNRWAMVAGQKGIGDTNKEWMFPNGVETLEGPLTEVGVSRKEYKDLLEGTVTFNCISRNGLQAEEIANELFMALTVFKDEIKLHGIHMIHGISMGEESIIRSNASTELTVVPVTLQYTAQRTLTSSMRTYDMEVTYDGETVYEGIHYRVSPAASGVNYDTIVFRHIPPDGTEITATYADLITLSTIEDDLSSQVDYSGENHEFNLSSRAYGYYKVVRAFDVVVDHENEDYMVTSSGITDDTPEYSTAIRITGSAGLGDADVRAEVLRVCEDFDYILITNFGYFEDYFAGTDLESKCIPYISLWSKSTYGSEGDGWQRSPETVGDPEIQIYYDYPTAWTYGYVVDEQRYADLLADVVSGLNTWDLAGFMLDDHKATHSWWYGADPGDPPAEQAKYNQIHVLTTEEYEVLNEQFERDVGNALGSGQKLWTNGVRLSSHPKVRRLWEGPGQSYNQWIEILEYIVPGDFLQSNLLDEDVQVTSCIVGSQLDCIVLLGRPDSSSQYELDGEGHLNILYPDEYYPDQVSNYESYL